MHLEIHVLRASFHLFLDIASTAGQTAFILFRISIA